MKYYTIAIEGDLCDCPLHGKTKIVINKKEKDEAFAGVATIGDKAECGCDIIEGSTQVIIHGRGVAYQGAKLSSGGYIIGASGNASVAL